MNKTDPVKKVVDGEVRRTPWIFDDGQISFTAFDENHSLSDIARWIISECREDGEEMVQILSEMLS